MNWGANLLRHLSVKVKVTGCRPTQEAAILVGNHVSYLDIPLVCSQVPGLFVAKSGAFTLADPWKSRPISRYSLCRARILAVSISNCHENHGKSFERA